MDAAHCRAVFALAERRIAERVPLAYLLGKTHYAGYEFCCEPGVVIPRSPISQLIARGLRPWLRRAPMTIVDVGCGTGCLGILCAHAFPQARVTLVDLHPQAVALARRNVAAHDLENRVVVLASDLFAQVPPGCFDVVISNPPYVDAVDLAALPAEYQHEPRLGLAGGDDGLDVVARLLQEARARLTRHGLLVCEVGGAAPALSRRVPRLPFTWPDLPAGGEGVFVLEAGELQSANGFGQRA